MLALCNPVASAQQVGSRRTTSRQLRSRETSGSRSPSHFNDPTQLYNNRNLDVMSHDMQVRPKSNTGFSSANRIRQQHAIILNNPTIVNNIKIVPKLEGRQNNAIQSQRKFATNYPEEHRGKASFLA